MTASRPHPPRTPFAAPLSVFIFMALAAWGTTAARAWGVKGHRIVNGRAVDSLKSSAPPLYKFYARAAHRSYLIEHSSDPDTWRRFDKSEGPRHFIDLDSYGSEAPFPALPRQRDEAEKLFGAAFVARQGVVPWTIEYRYGLLVKAFRKRLTRSILFQSAALGHYVGDAHVPFHATANYDGQLSKQKGIHARFESEMVNRSVRETGLRVARARPLADVVEAAFGWAVDSFKLKDALLQADREAAARDARYGDVYYQLFTPRALPIARRRLQTAATALGSLLLSAWTEAGRPALPPPLVIAPAKKKPAPAVKAPPLR